MMIDKEDVDTAELPIPADIEERLPPFSSLVRIRIAALSHQGNVRENNEDHYLVSRAGRYIETLLSNLPEGELPAHADETAYIFAVADGMGGLAGGEVASRLAIRTLIDIVVHVPDWIMRLDEEHAEEILERATRYYEQVNATLLERARKEPQLRGMGTTMTAAYSVGDDLFIAHVGDSRAYIFRDGRLRLLTRDQTQAQLLADAGIIRQEEVSAHRLGNVLTNALGGAEGEVKTQVYRLRLFDGDRLLLCTDGLTDMVGDDAIAAVLEREDEPAEACRLLVHRALENGGKDNVTVVLARYAIPPSGSEPAN